MSRNVTVVNPTQYSTVGIRPYANPTINVNVKYGTPVVLNFDTYGYSEKARATESFVLDNGLTISIDNDISVANAYTDAAIAAIPSS